ncbi:MAG TPA: hypothetical protein VF263_18735 [Longimicrobiaceae bacterium]
MATFDYRRKLSRGDEMKAAGAAAGAAVAVGAVVLYLARVMLQRTPLRGLSQVEAPADPAPAALPRAPRR